MAKNPNKSLNAFVNDRERQKENMPESLRDRLTGMRDNFSNFSFGKMFGNTSTAAAAESTQETGNPQRTRAAARNETRTQTINTAYYTTISEGQHKNLRKGDGLADILAKIYNLLKTQQEEDRQKASKDKSFFREEQSKKRRKRMLSVPTHTKISKSGGKPNEYEDIIELLSPAFKILKIAFEGIQTIFNGILAGVTEIVKGIASLTLGVGKGVFSLAKYAVKIALFAVEKIFGMGKFLLLLLPSLYADIRGLVILMSQKLARFVLKRIAIASLASGGGVGSLASSAIKTTLIAAGLGFMFDEIIKMKEEMASFELGEKTPEGIKARKDLDEAHAAYMAFKGGPQGYDYRSTKTAPFLPKDSQAYKNTYKSNYGVTPEEDKKRHDELEAKLFAANEAIFENAYKYQTEILKPSLEKIGITTTVAPKGTKDKFNNPMPPTFSIGKENLSVEEVYALNSLAESFSDLSKLSTEDLEKMFPNATAKVKEHLQGFKEEADKLKEEGLTILEEVQNESGQKLESISKMLKDMKAKVEYAMAPAQVTNTTVDARTISSGDAAVEIGDVRNRNISVVEAGLANARLANPWAYH